MVKAEWMTRREILLQAKLIRTERYALHQARLTLKCHAAIEHKLMTMTDIEILARINDGIRQRCGGVNNRYFRASDAYLSTLNV